MARWAFCEAFEEGPVAFGEGSFLSRLQPLRRFSNAVASAGRENSPTYASRSGRREHVQHVGSSLCRQADRRQPVGYTLAIRHVETRGVTSNVSPTTSAAAERRALTGTVEAVVFREVLKPLAAALGPLGDVMVGAVADRIFARPPR